MVIVPGTVRTYGQASTGSAGRQKPASARKSDWIASLATLLNEIHEAVAGLAKDRGLTYVVKVSPGPRPDSLPTDVETALKSSVVYADPRNDLTEKVVRDLNQRYSADKK